MRALLQRVTHASVNVNRRQVGQIGHGLVILLGIKEGDSEEQASWLAKKCVHLRIFDDAQGHFDRSLHDVAGQVLAVPQFTLYGDARRGRRPSFSDAAHPEVALPLFERFCQYLRQEGVHVETGEFGANMLVEIHNDGPVTLWLDTELSRRGNVKA